MRISISLSTCGFLVGVARHLVASRRPWYIICVGSDQIAYSLFASLVYFLLVSLKILSKAIDFALSFLD